MIKPQHNKLVFFFALLISLFSNNLISQISQKDTLTKAKVDTILPLAEDDDLLENPINYIATDSAVFLNEKKQAFLYGKAKVNFGDMNLEAEVIEIDYSKNIITAYGRTDSLGKKVGNPKFKDGEQEMNADKIIYNLKTKKGKIFNALTKQGELLVIGNEIKKDSTNIVYMKNMKCIPCQQEDARTIFRASRAKIIPNDKIITGPMYLEIGGVPTPLGLPFGFFPNSKKQHNGILIPTPGNSATQGFNLRNGGYYWGINNKTDMVIRGDIYANLSWALNATNNYNVLYKATGSTYISYSQFNIGDVDIPASFTKQKAYEVRWSHTQSNKSNPSIHFGASVNYVKNQSFNRINAVNSGQFLQNSFQSNINFTKTFKLSSLSLNATHSQNAISKLVEFTFPSLTFNVNRFFPFRKEGAVKQTVFDKIGINYLLEARNTLSGYDSTIFKGNIPDSLKYGFKHTLPISTNFNVFKFITVTPGLNLSAVMYTKYTQKDFSDGVLTTSTKKGFVAGYDANFSTAFNTKVFFDYYFKRGKLTQIRHLLIPTISYLYRPDFGKEQYGIWKNVQLDTIGNKSYYSVFQNSIFSGPGQGEQNSLSLNLSNNIEAKLKQKTDTGGVTYTKKTLMQNISLTTAYNFAADSFNMSMVGVSARTKLFKYFDVVASSGFDPYGYDKVSNRRVKEFSYNYSNNFARLTNASFAVNASFSSNMLDALKKTRQAPSVTNGAEVGAKNDLNEAEKLPWNLNIYYNLALNNPDDRKLQPTQTLNFSGDLKPTKYWKIGITSGYDFTTQKASYTSFNIYRDLKCWEARIDWIPFGLRKSYSLTINLKASMLSEFKIPKKSPPIDNF